MDIWECSLVTFPANDSARVQGVKNIELIESIRDAEKYLRDAGFSRSEAVALLSRIKSLGQRDADGDDMKRLVEALNKRGQAITTSSH